MSDYKLLTFENDKDIVISELAGDIYFKFSFTSESLFVTKKELSELIKILQVFEEKKENDK